MQTKRLFSFLAGLLSLAMLLPLSSCTQKGGGGVETSAVQTTEETTLQSPIEDRGAVIPHSKAMLSLKNNWENYDEEQKRIYDYSLFEDWHEGDHARKEGEDSKEENEKYLIKVFWEDEYDLTIMSVQGLCFWLSDIVYFSREEKMMVCWFTTEQMLTLAAEERMITIPPTSSGIYFSWPSVPEEDFPANVRFEAARGFLDS